MIDLSEVDVCTIRLVLRSQAETTPLGTQMSDGSSKQRYLRSIADRLDPLTSATIGPRR